MSETLRETSDVIEIQTSDPVARCGCGTVLVSVDCSHCEGSGRRHTFSRRRCGWCAGEGEVFVCPKCDT